MSENMTTWMILPRDPVIVRDGRPFGPDPGARADSLPFPFPSTIAGAVRERHGLKLGGFGDNGVDASTVLKVAVQGPFLVQLGSDGAAQADLLLPTPHDALLLQDQDTSRIKRCWLRPLGVAEDAHSDLAVTSEAPWYVGMATPDKSKSLSGAPTFWWWPAYQEWLEAAQDGPVDDAGLGICGLIRESRVHVRIDAASRTANEGFLFQTGGLEFNQHIGNKASALPIWGLTDIATFGLLVSTSADMDQGAGSLGGERRTVFWQSAEPTNTPGCSDAIKRSIRTSKACRLILATPALFAGGWQPDLSWLGIDELKVQVKAAIVNRYDVVSGWDYAAKMAKKTRRLAPAGAVYYLSLAGSSDHAIDRFIEAVWFKPISDAEQDRLDGFGTAMLGTWNGEQYRQEVKQ